MPDIITPNAQLEQRLDATGSPTFSAKQTSESHNHGTNHLLTKGLITTNGWTLAGLVNKAPNFHLVPTVHFSDPGLLQEIRTHEDSGIPLIIQGFHEHENWPTDLFTLDWLNEHGKPGASARNVCNWSDFDLPLSELIRKLRATQIYASENDTERLYGKDAECPHEWETWLSTSGVLPNDLLPHGTNDYLNYLPSDVQTLMCYLGVGDTFTPFHKDLCASSGQNLMCYTENGGSSFWFMTTSSAAPDMAEYFHKMGEELDFETHVITLEELRQSNLDIYIAEQQLGDLVLVPPRSCHQVINNCGITMKTSWSRMTLKGLQDSLYHELPIYHRVCRPETYKVKVNIYRALHHQTRVLQELQEQQTCSTHSDRSSPGIGSMLEKVACELHHLLDLLDDVLGEEYSSEYQDMPHADTSHQDNITCDFCGADVFQSFFECMSCTSQSHIIYEEMKVGDGIVICPLCYIEGRSCKCGVMKPTQYRPFGDLLRTRDDALCAIRAVCANTVRDYRSLSDHPNSITSKRHVGIFRAACALYERRLRFSAETRMCWSRPVSHQVLHSSHIYCKPCHNGRCLTHVLEIFHTHSAPAILISEGVEGSPQDWHEYHNKSKAEFKQAQARILHDEKTGERPDFRVKLAYVASKFRICTSINPNATRPGWYDNCLDASVTPSPSKDIVNLSGSDLRHGGGPAISSTDGEPSLIAESLSGRSASLSDLTSLPSDYQGSPSSTRKSLFTARQLPGIPLVNGKNRRVVMDYVSLPHLQQERKQLPASSDRSSSSMVIDHASGYSRSMSDDDDTSRPPKRQRVALPSKELPRKVALPLRLEKRVSSGTVYITNKPRFPIESSSSSLSAVKKVVGIQVDDDTQIALQKQVDLALAENVRLKLANDVLKRDREVIESEICDLQKRNEELTNVAQKHHAQFCRMRDRYNALKQEFSYPSSTSSPLATRSQQGTHPRAFYAEAPPTEPHAFVGLPNEPPPAALGYDTGHSFQIGMHRSFAAAPIQNVSHHSRHPEKGGSRNDTVQQPCVPCDENSPRVPDPFEARSEPSASVEGNLPLPMETEISLTISDGTRYPNAMSSDSINVILSD